MFRVFYILAVSSLVRSSSSSSILLIYCHLLLFSVFIITVKIAEGAEVNRFNIKIII